MRPMDYDYVNLEGVVKYGILGSESTYVPFPIESLLDSIKISIELSSFDLDIP